MGDSYTDPYFVGDRFVTVRKNPYNVTVRYRATGRLIGRLELPDLTARTGHPLLENGPRALPVARDGPKLVMTDGWYYLMVDTDRMVIDWKRLIDAKDATREPAMRFALKGGYLAVLKEDYDKKTIYMLSSKTGDVLWRTDPKDAKSPQPLHSMYIEGEHIHGIGVYAGQGFYYVKRECKTGRLLYQTTVKGYGGRPAATLVPWNYNGRAIVQVKDRQHFELNVFDMKTGERLDALKKKGVGEFGRHGNVSGAVQNGRIVMLSKDRLDL